jgi:hypothetical protein
MNIDIEEIAREVLKQASSAINIIADEKQYFLSPLLSISTF